MTRTDFADAFATTSADAGMTPEQAERFAGPAPLLPDDSDWPPATVICEGGEHETPANGQPCQECNHGCSMPGDPNCKGRP